MKLALEMQIPEASSNSNGVEKPASKEEGSSKEVVGDNGNKGSEKYRGDDQKRNENGNKTSVEDNRDKEDSMKIGHERRKRVLNGYHLTEADVDNMMKGIMEGIQLTDREIDFSQHLLKCQFPSLKGLQSTLLCSQRSQS